LNKLLVFKVREVNVLNLMSAAVSQQQRGRTRSNQQALQLHAQATAQQQAQASQHQQQTSQQQQQSTHISGRETDTTDVASLMSEDLPDGQAILVPTRLRNVIQLQAQPVVRLIKVGPMPPSFSRILLTSLVIATFPLILQYVCSFPVEATEQEARMQHVQRQLQMIAVYFKLVLIPVTFSDNISSLRVNLCF
jgi:hypothetical protein